MFGVEKVLSEGGAAGEQVEARPTWARVPKGRAIREGNEGLTGDLRKFFEELTPPQKLVSEIFLKPCIARTSPP